MLKPAKKLIEWIDLKQLFKFGKARLILLIVMNAITIFFVDLLHIPFWIFTIFFTPLNFLTNYLVDRHVFRWKARDV